MIDKRKIAFDNVSRILAITKVDIEQHQLINDLSLNIHGENWFRDIFNHIYHLNLQNDNFNTSNAPAIDLVDTNKKLAYQITTTRTKEKVENTLKKIKETKYKEYTLKIFFLLDKAQFKDTTISYFKDKYSIDTTKHILDSTDLIKEVADLPTPCLLDLNEQFFKINTEKYTNEIVLDLIFKHIIAEKKNIRLDFNDSFGTVDTNTKISLNNINNRISSKINAGLDYRPIIDNYISDVSLITDLKKIIIDVLYRNILLKALESKTSKVKIINRKTNELQKIAKENAVDFNKLINKLHQEIESTTLINDFNSMDIAWIIIAYFFELCDIGVDDLC